MSKTKHAETGKRKAISKQLRFEIFNRDDFTCQYCGQKAPNVVLHVDHIHPVSKGGTNDHGNLRTACSACNGGKSATDIITKPERTIPTISIQANTDEWKEKRARIIDRDGNKCTRCGTENKIGIYWVNPSNDVELTSLNDRAFIAVCESCIDKVRGMMRSIDSFITDTQINYRFYDVDCVEYLMNFLGAIYMGTPNDPTVKHIFSAIDLFYEHQEACEEAREECEQEEGSSH